MKLTGSQQKYFWREWGGIVAMQGWDAVAGDVERKKLLGRCGFGSLKEVDKLEGFDRVMAELALVRAPEDLDAQVRQAQMPRERLMWAIRELEKPLKKPLTLSLSPSDGERGVSGYLGRILEDRFGHRDLDRLSLEELVQLRNTLSARKGSRLARKKMTNAECRMTKEADPF